MSGHFTVHPLYRADGEGAGLATDALMAAGQTVFQVFQMADNEPEHCQWLLQCADRDRTIQRVLSLGCGVGGMEAHWHLLRPELEFELVNISQAQLDRCLCKGEKVKANAEDYHSKREPFDMVVIAYLLGHVDVHKTLASALANLAPWGTMLIYDVFEGTSSFRETLLYDTPQLRDKIGRAHV